MSLTDDKAWFDKLSEAEKDEALAIESELISQLGEGLPEDLSFAFGRAVMAIRPIVPGAAVSNIFDLALREGLIALIKKLVDPKQKESAKTRVRGVRGV